MSDVFGTLTSTTIALFAGIVVRAMLR